MKMTAKEIVEVIKGFEDEKEIQFHDTNKWRKTDCVSLIELINHIMYNHEIYRVKPENKYRPYELLLRASLFQCS